MTRVLCDFYRPDLAYLAGPGPEEDPAVIATEVITSASECSEWMWVRT